MVLISYLWLFADMEVFALVGVILALVNIVKRSSIMEVIGWVALMGIGLASLVCVILRGSTNWSKEGD
jgi:hypothetical protein